MSVNQDCILITVSESETMSQIFPEWLRLAYDGEGYEPYDLNMPPTIPRRPVADYRHDPPLTEHGAIVAELVGKSIRQSGHAPFAIYCSPELASVQTASSIARASGTGLAVLVDPALARWPGLAPPEANKQWMTTKQLSDMGLFVNEAYSASRDANTLSPSETPQQYITRLVDFMARVSTKGDRKVVIVADAAIIPLARNTGWTSAEQLCAMRHQIRPCTLHAIEVGRKKKSTVVTKEFPPLTRTVFHSRQKMAQREKH